MRSFRQLVVWQRAEELTLKIYQITEKFPVHEKYGIVSQLRRASSSIMSNIAEGNERLSKKDCLRFLEIARSSLVELDCFVDLSLKLNYLSLEEFESINELLSRSAYLLRQFYQSQFRNTKRN